MVLSAAKKHILVVDDDTLIVSLLEAGLEESDGNYAVTTAFSAAEALAKLSQERYALVITDYQMPDMNGVKLTQQIRTLSSTTRIILMSAHPPDVMEELVGEIQADGYLEKPISIYQLWDLVEQLVSER